MLQKGAMQKLSLQTKTEIKILSLFPETLRIISLQVKVA